MARLAHEHVLCMRAAALPRARPSSRWLVARQPLCSPVRSASIMAKRLPNEPLSQLSLLATRGVCTQTTFTDINEDSWVHARTAYGAGLCSCASRTLHRCGVHCQHGHGRMLRSGAGTGPSARGSCCGHAFGARPSLRLRVRCLTHRSWRSLVWVPSRCVVRAAPSTTFGTATLIGRSSARAIVRRPHSSCKLSAKGPRALTSDLPAPVNAQIVPPKPIRASCRVTVFLVAGPLASGALGVPQAIGFLSLQLGAGLGVLLALPPYAVALGF